MNTIRLNNVIIPFQGSTDAVDITITNHVIDSITPSPKDPTNQHAPSAANSSQPPPSLILPSLCHPHIHLDKPYILTSNHRPQESASDGAYPDYSDLAPQTGSFAEALRNTALAKARYTPADLHLRGAQLLAASARAGVTHARAFVEVDGIAGLAPLRAGIALKQAFAPLIDVQLCAFAQEPLFSGGVDSGAANRAALLNALRGKGEGKDVGSQMVAALGTTPYVETSRAAALQNIDFAVSTALERGLHLDFHLDYNLDAPADRPPLVHAVIDALLRYGWPTTAPAAAPGDNSSESGANTNTAPKTVALGHCTQLTRLTRPEMAGLACKIKKNRLPVHFVGLPTSDLFMMGRDDSGLGPHMRPRGTLPVVSLVREGGLAACLGVNNVGNAFTPFGTGDPLALASWGVGLYHAGTARDAALLYGCVSWRARRAIGCVVGGEEAWEAEESEGDRRADSGDAGRAGWLKLGSKCPPMLMVRNRHMEELPQLIGTGESTLKIPARQRLSVKDVVWDPPDLKYRSVVHI